MNDREFTNNWFQQNIPSWKYIFSKIINPNNEVHGIEIGSYEGQSTCWIADHVLIHPKSTLTCIDTFKGSIEHQTDILRGLKDRFNENIRTTGRENQINVFEEYSFNKLIKLNQENIRVDFIYIDGSHIASDVLTDAVLSLNLLKKGGVMIFDDYTWRYDKNPINPIMSPQIAINSFLTINYNKLEILSMLPSRQMSAIKIV